MSVALCCLKIEGTQEKCGMIRLYDRIGYPRIELFAMRDEHGNLLEDDIDLIRLADNLIAVWNDACK